MCTFNSDLHKIRTALDLLEHNYCVIRGASVPVYQTTWHHIAKDWNIPQHQRENLVVGGRGLAGYNWPDHDQQRCYHHAPTVKPEAANAVLSS
jgi:hypothetical protein